MVRLLCFGLLLTLTNPVYCQKNNNNRLSFFDVVLLRNAAEDQVGNIMLSPASIKSVLAMLLEGSGGQTEEELRVALRLMPNKKEAREEMNAFIKALKFNNNKTILESANGIFVSDKHMLEKAFEVLLPQVYSSEVLRTNYLNATAASDRINGWVSDKTKGFIRSIVEAVQIKPSTDIILVNALYFKSNWKNAFDPLATRSGCFYRQPSVCSHAAMMDLDAELKYAYVQDLAAHALELPYEGNKYSMFLLVPQDRGGWTTLVRDLPFMSLHHIIPLMQPTDVLLTMPRFKVESNVDMVPILKKMRIEQLFKSSANLSGILKGHSPQVNNIFHKVYLNVDEKGTEAASATGAQVNPLIGNQWVTLKVDRPFVFFIRDNEAGVILFEGKIDEPIAMENIVKGATNIQVPAKKKL